VIDLNLDHAAKFPVGRQLRPAVQHSVRIGCRIWVDALAIAAISRDHHQRAGRDADHQCQPD